MDQLPSDIEGARPHNGFVPDEETAVKIAEAVWIPIYGKSVLRQKPYKATLADDKIWLVEGTKGMSASAGINKYTEEILRVNQSANSIDIQHPLGRYTNLYKTYYP
jgi:hypothetical protein